MTNNKSKYTSVVKHTLLKYLFSFLIKKQLHFFSDFCDVTNLQNFKSVKVPLARSLKIANTVNVIKIERPIQFRKRSFHQTLIQIHSIIARKIFYFFFYIKLPVLRPPPDTNTVTTSDSYSPPITGSITVAESHSPSTIESVTAADTSGKSEESPHTGVGIIAAVIGVLIGVLLVVVMGFLFFYWRNKDKRGTFLNDKPLFLVSLILKNGTPICDQKYTFLN